MSAGSSGQLLTRVQSSIEKCLRLYMNQKEVINTLYMQEKIEPRVTELVWQKLEEENQEFFRAYYLRLMVKEQIMEFNKLLSEQVELMRRLGPAGFASMSIPNGAYLPLMQQNFTGCRAEENTGPSLKAETMQHPISGNLHNVFSNCRPPVQSCVQPVANISSHGRTVDVSTDALLIQSSNRSLAPIMDGGMIKTEPGYAGNSSFEFGAHNSLVDSRSALCEASVSSYSSAESNSQPLTETLLDADTSFGLLEQISQQFDFNLHSDFPDSNLHGNFANSSVFAGMLDSYSRPLFMPPNSDNFLEHHGDLEKFNAAPESFRYGDLGGD